MKYTNLISLHFTYICPQAEESLESVKVAIRNLKEFKTCFQEYKENLNTYFSAGEAYTPWDFRVSLLSLKFSQITILLQGNPGVPKIGQFYGKTANII